MTYVFDPREWMDCEDLDELKQAMQKSIDCQDAEKERAIESHKNWCKERGQFP